MDGRASSLSNYLPGGSFNFRLENYLRVNRFTKETMFAEVPGVLVQKDENTHELLAASDVTTLSNYSGYYTLLRYDKRARFVNGVSDAMNTARAIVEAKRLSESV